MSTQNTNLERQTFAKTLGRGEIWAFAFGSVVGWGWVMLAGGWVSSAGSVGELLSHLLSQDLFADLSEWHSQNFAR